MTDEVQPSLPISNAIDTEALELDAGEDDALLSDLVASPRPITSDRSQTPRGGWSTPRSVTPIINNITLPDPYSNAPSRSGQRPDSASSARASSRGSARPMSRQSASAAAVVDAAVAAPVAAAPAVAAAAAAAAAATTASPAESASIDVSIVMPAVETSPPRERLESEEARLDSPPRIASAPLRMGSAASPLRRTGTAASTRSSPGRPSVPMDVPKADIELPSENRSPTRAQRRGYAYGLPTTTASETMRAAAAAAGVSSELDNSSSAARGRGRGEIGDAQLMPPREGVAAGRAARRGGAEAMASHPALAAAMSEPYLAALLQRVPLQPDAAQQQMLDEHASASAARAAATRKRRAMHAALATTRLGVDNIIAVAHGASRPRRAVTNGIDSTPFYRDSRARAQRRREKGVKAELSFGAKPGVGFSRQSRFAAGTRLDCAVTLTSAALPTAGERVFDPSSAEAKAKGMSAAARSSALLSAAASVSPLRRGFKVRHVAGEEAAVLARRERRRAHAVALTESTRTKSDNVAWEMGVLQLANHAGAPRETHAHYRWQFDRDMKRKKPRREIYGDALGDGQSAAYGSASPVRGRGLSASQQWGSMAKGAVGSSVRSRWGGVGPIHGVGEKAKSLVQHLGIEIGSTPGGRFASRDVRFDPNNPLFPEVAMLRGMGGLGVPSRTQVHGPRGFFRKDPISIEASAQRARARGEANAARTANANAMKLSRPLELAPDGTLKEFSPEKIPYLGSSTARIGSVEFYRGNDVSAPLQSNPSVSGRVPHGTSVEEVSEEACIFLLSFFSLSHTFYLYVPCASFRALFFSFPSYFLLLLSDDARGCSGTSDCRRGPGRGRRISFFLCNETRSTVE